MIDSKIWALGAIRISVEVAEWRGNKTSPASFICRIEHSASDPAITATRPNALEAEREAVAAFIAFWEPRQGRRTHPGRTLDRKLAPGEKAEAPPLNTAKRPAAPKPEPDDFEY